VFAVQFSCLVWKNCFELSAVKKKKTKRKSFGSSFGETLDFLWFICIASEIVYMQMTVIQRFLCWLTYISRIWKYVFNHCKTPYILLFCTIINMHILLLWKKLLFDRRRSKRTLLASFLVCLVIIRLPALAIVQDKAFLVLLSTKRRFWISYTTKRSNNLYEQK
jgi:hypothetical protein